MNLVKPIKRRVFNKATGIYDEENSSIENSIILSDSEDDEAFKRSDIFKSQSIQTDGPAIVLPSERHRSKLHNKIVPMLYG